MLGSARPEWKLPFLRREEARVAVSRRGAVRGSAGRKVGFVAK